MKMILRFIDCWVILVLLTRCEKPITIKPVDTPQLLVVEGHIETQLPPYVFLTKSQSFFNATNLSTIDSSFVSGAVIKVSDGTTTYTLKEYSSNSLPSSVADSISKRLGVKLASSSDPNGLRVIVYTNLQLNGQVGGVYNLDVEALGQHLTSSTTIPQPTPLDSLWWVPDPTNDSLATIYVRYSDPAGVNNYIRYFTSTNGGLFFPPYFNSVFDDNSLFNVDGKTFNFPIEKGHYYYEDINLNTYTYFNRGDSVIVKWAAIDKAHFDFWNTAEYSRNSIGNPFSSPTKIKSNINGGLGIWGGYSPVYYTLVIK